MKITYLGHSAVRVETNGEVVLIDPFLIGAREYNYKVDNIKNILVTHAHNDHLGSAVEISKATGAPVVGVFELANHLSKKGVEAIGANLGGWLNFSWGRAKLCPASHSSTFLDGSSGGVPVGFLLEIEGKLIYHAGDTGLIQDFKTIKEYGEIEFAFLPIGGFYTMDIKEAVKGASWMGAKRVCPIHYNTFPPIAVALEDFEAECVAKSIAPKIINIMEMVEI